MIVSVKTLPLFYFVALFCSCTTLPNRNDPYSRRDLYNPEYATIRRQPSAHATPAPQAKPEFR